MACRAWDHVALYTWRHNRPSLGETGLLQSPDSPLAGLAFLLPLWILLVTYVVLPDTTQTRLGAITSVSVGSRGTQEERILAILEMTRMNPSLLVIPCFKNKKPGNLITYTWLGEQNSKFLTRHGIKIKSNVLTSLQQDNSDNKTDTRIKGNNNNNNNNTIIILRHSVRLLIVLYASIRHPSHSQPRLYNHWHIFLSLSYFIPASGWLMPVLLLTYVSSHCWKVKIPISIVRDVVFWELGKKRPI